MKRSETRTAYVEVYVCDAPDCKETVEGLAWGWLAVMPAREVGRPNPENVEHYSSLECLLVAKIPGYPREQWMTGSEEADGKS